MNTSNFLVLNRKMVAKFCLATFLNLKDLKVCNSLKINVLLRGDFINYIARLLNYHFFTNSKETELMQ